MVILVSGVLIKPQQVAPTTREREWGRRAKTREEETAAKQTDLCGIWCSVIGMETWGVALGREQGAEVRAPRDVVCGQDSLTVQDWVTAR